METLTKICSFLLVIYLSGGVTCRSMPPVRHYTLERLNIKRTDLKHMCDARGANLYEDVHSRHISFTLNLTERFMTWKKEVSPTDDVYKLVQERCNKDATLKDMLKKFIASSQFCMEEKDRLKDDKLQALTSRLMELFCAQYIHSHAFSSDEGCLDLVTNAAIDTCKEKYKTDQFIPLPFVYSNKECNDYQRYSECRLEAMKSCKDTTKTAVEAADSIMFHTFYGCQNISVIPEKITIKRSINENDEFVRLNISDEIFEEKCNINANVTFVNIKERISKISEVINEKRTQYVNIVHHLASQFSHFNFTEKMASNIKTACIEQPIFNNSLKTIYETVELCLSENERPTLEQKTKLLRQSVDYICSFSVKLGLLLNKHHIDCFTPGVFLDLALCKLRLPNNVFLNDKNVVIMTLPEDCSMIFKTFMCKLDALKECDSSAELQLKSIFNDDLKFSGCDYMYFE
ncbi:uncharacterized protein LOC122500811 [Leptopilina heterotoma]|uniref:uncharacterized protein LOC122500811 n=1 Tax=Leptopilina heterotoma TaxID=63436 RepID=UPI001CA88862|nr:uncharacterized protein LOC122500811 [Leptopilina heterotoma]